MNIKLQNLSKSPFLSFLKDGKDSNVNNFEKPKLHFDKNVSFTMDQLSFFEKSVHILVTETYLPILSGKNLSVGEFQDIEFGKFSIL